MTSIRMMKEILSKMPEKPRPMHDLIRIFDRSEGNLRHDLKEMVELGLIVKEDIDEPGIKNSRRKVGWRKTKRC